MEIDTFRGVGPTSKKPWYWCRTSQSKLTSRMITETRALPGVSDDATKLKEIISVEYDVLIVPTFLKNRPVYAELTRLQCRILYVDTEDEETGKKQE